jgi:hypothetical protein
MPVIVPARARIGPGLRRSSPEKGVVVGVEIEKVTAAARGASSPRPRSVAAVTRVLTRVFIS